MCHKCGEPCAGAQYLCGNGSLEHDFNKWERDFEIMRNQTAKREGEIITL
jgi:hypothetical protein